MIPKRCVEAIQLMAVLLCVSSINAAESPSSGDDTKKKVTALIKDLSSDDFDVRECAVETLAAMGDDVVALVKETMATTTDTDTKSRCETVLQKIKVESDPDAAKEAADKKRDAKD